MVLRYKLILVLKANIYVYVLVTNNELRMKISNAYKTQEESQVGS